MTVSPFSHLRRLVDHALGAPRSATRDVRGILVVVNNTRPEIDTGQVFARLDEALGLIEATVPHHYRHLQRDFARILVERYPCRGAFMPADRTCLVELTFSVNTNFSAAQIAATILHEAMHARLHQLGFPLDMADRARQERFCRRAEVEFGLKVADGEVIVQRALAALASADTEVAPTIDWALAAQRIAQADGTTGDRDQG